MEEKNHKRDERKREEKKPLEIQTPVDEKQL
jgi:hypothetical protein